MAAQGGGEALFCKNSRLHACGPSRQGQFEGQFRRQFTGISIAVQVAFYNWGKQGGRGGGEAEQRLRPPACTPSRAQRREPWGADKAARPRGGTSSALSAAPEALGKRHPSGESDGRAWHGTARADGRPREIAIRYDKDDGDGTTLVEPATRRLAERGPFSDGALVLATLAGMPPAHHLPRQRPHSSDCDREHRCFDVPVPDSFK